MKDSTRRKIYLDMDGVLANFMYSAVKLFVDNDTIIFHLLRTWPLHMSLHDLVGVAEGQFWNRINQGGTSFWAGLRIYPWTVRLLKLAEKHGDVFILSSPARGANSAGGKVVWIEKNITDYSRKFILTPKQHKRLLARPGDILVDDHVKTCAEWEESGGHAILFPQPWNGNFNVEDPCERVALDLMALRPPA